MDQIPTTSVIVPVFQDLEGLRACLHGLERQSLASDHFEVVVVDNGSNPPVELPETMLRNVRMVCCDIPGAYAARNAGVRVASGGHLAFTDADCVPQVHWLENGLKTLDSAGRDVIVGGDVWFFSPQNPTAVSLYQTMTGFLQSENIEVRGFSATANILCSRKVFDRVGPFDETLLSGGDREWAWRARGVGVETIFSADVIVETNPRMSLRGALRQARRVAAGRYHLQRSGLAAGRLASLRPHRGVLATFLWIVTRREVGLFDRFCVLTVAGVIKAVSILEGIRIRLGGRAERR